MHTTTQGTTILKHLVAMVCVLAAPAATAAAPPQWLLEEIAFQTRDGGRWVASNANYQSDEERWAAYGVQWTAGPGGASMSGTLFGISNGQDSEPFWQFSQYWDPARGEVVIQQSGWYTVGIGTVWQEGDALKMQQTFTPFVGASRVEGHVTQRDGADAYRTTSFSIDGTVWQVKRSYRWVHQAPD